MKAENRILVKLLPALLLTSSMVMVGCIAQTGTTDEQSSSSSEALNEAPTVTTPTAKTEKVQRTLQQNVFHDGTQPVEPTPTSVGPARVQGTDPGTPSQDDDGNEPVPNPWQPHAASGIQH